MADETIPTTHPTTPATTVGPIPLDRQPPFSQTTHPSTTAHGESSSGVPAAEDNKDDEQ